ncbi:hypothetical protein [Stackebrandtia soli]|uniref:hypothetical protein n=1 Tax=Stackebrandtia soli TaxID=1892856 RepID=UPI0039ED1F25
MPDPFRQRPRPKPAPEDIVTSAFAAYRAEAPISFTPPSATALMARAPRRPRRRALSVSVAALACTGLMLSGVAITQTMTSSPSGNVEAIGSDESSAPDTLNQSSTSTDSAPGTDVPASPDPVEAELLARTVSLPAWPGELGEQCPAGEFRFTPPDDDDPHSLPPITDSPTPNGAWVLLPNNTHAKSTNLDGVDGDEVIVPVACGDVPGVIALSQEDDQFTSVAFVYAEEEPGEAIEVKDAQDTVVTLSMADGGQDKKKIRHFAFDGEEFTETTGPGDGTSPPPTDPGGDGSASPGEESPDPPGDTSTPQPNEDRTSPPPDGPRTHDPDDSEPQD